MKRFQNTYFCVCGNFTLRLVEYLSGKKRQRYRAWPLARCNYGLLFYFIITFVLPNKREPLSVKKPGRKVEGLSSQWASKGDEIKGRKWVLLSHPFCFCQSMENNLGSLFIKKLARAMAKGCFATFTHGETPRGVLCHWEVSIFCQCCFDRSGILTSGHCWEDKLRFHEEKVIWKRSWLFLCFYNVGEFFDL